MHTCESGWMPSRAKMNGVAETQGSRELSATNYAVEGGYIDNSRYHRGRFAGPRYSLGILLSYIVIRCHLSLSGERARCKQRLPFKAPFACPSSLRTAKPDYRMRIPAYVSDLARESGRSKRCCSVSFTGARQKTPTAMRAYQKPRALRPAH